LFGPRWWKLWIASLVLAALCGFASGWKERSENPPFVITTKSKEPLETELLRKGRYDEAAKAVLDSIKDEKKDYWRYQTVAVVYAARAVKDPANREKWLGQAAFYLEKSGSLAPEDGVNSMLAAFSMDRLGDISGQGCPYYEKARQLAEDALSHLKTESISVGDEKMPTQPFRDDIGKLLGRLQDKIAARCANKP